MTQLAVLVVGGGRLGACLARRLAAEGHPVTLVEPDVVRKAAVAADAEGVHLVTGDAIDLTCLEAAGIRTADVVVAVTDDDAHNLLVAGLARFEYGCERTIARVVDPTHAWLFDATSGVDIAVDQAELLTGLILAEVPADDASGPPPPGTDGPGRTSGAPTSGTHGP